MTGPDPLIAVIRRNFEAATAAYGVEPPGDVGVLLREIRRLERALAESTEINCNCTCNPDDDHATPEQFDAVLDAGEPVELAGSPLAVAQSCVFTSIPADSRVTIRGNGTITVELASPGRGPLCQRVELTDAGRRRGRSSRGAGSEQNTVHD